ncbi:hypothetical protein [Leuconostoc suionicum]|uniref:hypothetical protein n=1 Tax=Leuconostoc suionicum TaxID=1511761 RepID=UPI00090BE4C4|nr:hypothetical protein [Leuconostoc suionicum]API72130.1 hypothetical protein A6B45_05340 [Leuconostoc suionicum]BAX70746.1 hypothetical protein LEUCM_01308 [Leuconostoc suionicum]
MFGLTVDDFKILYFPKNLENGVITDDVVKNAKHCSDTFHDYLVNNRFFSSVSCFRVYDNVLFGFYKQAERCLKSGKTHFSNIEVEFSLMVGACLTCRNFLSGN